jgi:hypothetical protein
MLESREDRNERHRPKPPEIRQKPSRKPASRDQLRRRDRAAPSDKPKVLGRDDFFDDPIPF